jgi:hypothetical protein
MEKCRSDITAIVVGNARQTLVHTITAYLNRKNISSKVCEDIYTAVAAMAAAPAGTNLLVIGGFTTLAAEDMRLFSLALNGKKVVYCCLIEKWFAHLQTKLAAAARAGVIVINSTEQIENAIKQCQTFDTAVQQKAIGRDFASRIASLADNYFLTQAEHDALLGVEEHADAKS